MEMEDSTPTAKTEAEGVTVHVVSPSPEMPNKLTLPNLDKKLTLGELKLKIQDAIPARPSPSRQRLIYRARPLIRDEMVLEEILGSLEIHNPDGYTLHLVLPPSPTAASQASSTEARLSSTLPPPRPASTGQIPPGFTSRPYTPVGSNHPPFAAQQRHHPWREVQHPILPPSNAAAMQNPALRMGQLTPEMRQAMNHHFASLGGPWPPHFGLPGATPQIGNAPWQAQPPSHPHFHPQAPHSPMPALPTHQAAQMIALQQQMRAAMGAHGAGDPLATPVAAPTLGSNPSSGEQQPPAIPGSQQSLPNHGMIVQEGHAPNGSHWRMVINGPTTQIPTINFGIHETVQPLRGPPSTFPDSQEMRNSQPGPQLSEQPTIPGTVSNPQPTLSPNPWQVSVQDLSNRMAHLESAVASGVALSENAIWQLQVSYYDFLREQPLLQGRLENSINVRFTDLMARISRSRIATQSRTPRTVQLPAMNQNGIHTLTPQSSSSATTSTLVYLLSSPQGPQALLISPQGRYITPGFNVGPNAPRLAQDFTNIDPAQNTTVNPPDPTNDRRRVIRVVNQGRADRAEEAGPDAARDLVRILLPLGGHLWLLLRLFGFVWFFMGGADWRRTFLVMAIAIVVFLSQTAAFRPFALAVWEPIRRHVENLVPLAADNPVHLPGGNPRAEARDGSANRRQPRREPRPEDLAARLQRERNDREQSLLSRSFRRVERAMALFLASLVPGVGERHIAARNAAVAAREAVETEQEEQRRREESGPGEQGANPPTEGQDSTETRQSVEQPTGSTQPPLVDV